jgi:hypothetical protein
MLSIREGKTTSGMYSIMLASLVMKMLAEKRRLIPS